MCQAHHRHHHHHRRPTGSQWSGSSRLYYIKTNIRLLGSAGDQISLAGDCYSPGLSYTAWPLLQRVQWVLRYRVAQQVVRESGGCVLYSQHVQPAWLSTDNECSQSFYLVSPSLTCAGLEDSHPPRARNLLIIRQTFSTYLTRVSSQQTGELGLGWPARI